MVEHSNTHGKGAILFDNMGVQPREIEARSAVEKLH
jgi:hypothetical protein